MREIDLHVHTDISDGSESPESTVRTAKALGLRAIAVTDHDSVNGVCAAQEAGERYGVEVVSGIELTCGWYDKEVHILGYDIDVHSEKLPPVLDWVIDERNSRNERMVRRLAEDDIMIDLDELQARHPGSTIGRPHFALCLMEAGIADSVTDAFKRFLDPGQKYYIRRRFMSLEDGVGLIRAAGGKAVIAHPRQYRISAESLAELMERGKAAGVSGLECFYSGYGPEDTSKYLAMADRYGFCPTAGSDWHGRHKPHISMGSGIDGELCAPYELLENLRAHK